MKIHPQDPLPGQIPEPQGPVYTDDDEQEYHKVEKILSSRWRKQGRGKRLQYRAQSG